MCFLLYMAANTTIPDIAWNPQRRGVHTATPTENDEAWKSHFSLPVMKYVGSSLNCGCGFRNAMFQDGGWPQIEFRDVVELMPRDPEESAESQRNHEELAEFLSLQLKSDSVVELYGCWDGDQSAPTAAQEDVTVEQLRDPDFQFRDRCLYVVQNAT